jgi:hypothetical protein
MTTTRMIEVPLEHMIVEPLQSNQRPGFRITGPAKRAMIPVPASEFAIAGALARDIAYQELEKLPGAAGVYVRFSKPKNGHRVPKGFDQWRNAASRCWWREDFPSLNRSR